MDIVLAILLLLFISSLRLNLAGPSAGYLNRDTTATINGFFLLLVMFSHFNTYLPASSLGRLTTLWMTTKGELIVTTFLFFSGFGIMEQLQKRGTAYINTFPVKRILFVWAKFFFAVSLFLLLAFCLHQSYSFPRILLTYFGLTTIGNSGWYIFAILLLYCLTYLAFKLAPKSHRNALFYLLAGLAIYIIIASLSLPSWYHETILSYFAGAVFSLNQSKWCSFINKNWRHYVTTGFVTLLLFLSSYLLSALSKGLLHYAFYQVAAISFPFLFVLLTMKMALKNRFLKYVGGGAMFSLYILQRIPMMLLQKTSLMKTPIIAFILVLITTLALGWLFDHLIGHLLLRLTHKTSAR
ncbi:acyltransferase family protein [Secundilactobacillus mixtipabuli]|uniref:Acyltransferase n=1 Tax=Secundilactobacillus mixtipabuli TaxID=1435342 RepID=A0A1Z5IDB8_9LACO|nr:acyltransferase family protein [Secundilactobacillus mixtipabuli]GAW99803.1 acyltransferase [Secundilactobacillus mixtipabuli]